MKLNSLIIAAIGALVVGVSVGFVGGMQYQKAQTTENTGNLNFQRNFRQFPGGGPTGMRGPGGNGNFRGGAVIGEVLSSDDKSVTVKTADGGSKIVLISDKTQINRASEGKPSDLTTGTKVAVFGTTNSDGSVTAQNVQINPMAPMRFVQQGTSQ